MRGKHNKEVAISRLEVGPIRHATLTPNLVNRVESVASRLAEVDATPVSQWLEDFQHDRDPEKEIAVWESISGSYTLFSKRQCLSLNAKREALDLLLLWSLAGEQLVLKKGGLRHLKQSELVGLLELFKDICVFRRNPDTVPT